MSVVLEDAPPVAGGQHVRDRLAAWIAEHRLPEPASIGVEREARAAFVHCATVEDLTRWAVTIGYDIRVRRDGDGMSMWLRDPRESDIWCRLDGVPVPVDVYGPRVTL